MLSFQREVYKTELKNKLDYWKSPGVKDSFYGKLPVGDVISDFGIIRDGSGYFYMRDDFVAYYNLNNGHIIRIKKNWSLTDWNCYQQLHAKSNELNTFRLDIPLYREEIIMSDRNVWEYAELKSPGNSYGTNLFNHVFPEVELDLGIYENDKLYDGDKVNSSFFQDSLRGETVNYIIGYIEDVYTILHQAVLIAEANKCGLPDCLGDIANRYKDDIGFFWSDIDQSRWNTSKDYFLLNINSVLISTLNMLYGFGQITLEQQNQCINYAREKWILI